MKKYLCFAAVLMILFIAGCEAKEDDDVKAGGRGLFGFGEYVVGKNIKFDDITEFYDTEENINYDAYYQRYLFYVKDGKYYFFHERRERNNDYGPCTEEDAVSKGTLELTDEQWQAFCDLIGDGIVKARKDNADSGDKGPWYYIYWKGDKSKYQVYSFASYEKEKDFGSYCKELSAECDDTAPQTGEADIALIRLIYRPGYSDMAGAYHYQELNKNEAGEWILESRDREVFSDPIVNTIYEVNEEDIKQLEAFIRKPDIEALTQREDSDLFVTDYSAWGYTIEFSDNSTGEKKEYNIEEYKEYTDEDYGLIRELGQRIKDIRGGVISETEEDE